MHRRGLAWATLVGTALASQEHPVCRKHGHIVNITEDCCQQMGTWAKEMEGIAQYMAQQQKGKKQSVSEEGSESFCNLKTLSYDQYVQCECQKSDLMDYIGSDITLKCPKEAQVPSDYPCLPKVCDRNDAKVLLMNETYHGCQIIAIIGGPLPDWHSGNGRMWTIWMVLVLLIASCGPAIFYKRRRSRSKLGKERLEESEPYRDDELELPEEPFRDGAPTGAHEVT